jgi:hypothetical protein
MERKGADDWLRELRRTVKARREKPREVHPTDTLS